MSSKACEGCRATQLQLERWSSRGAGLPTTRINSETVRGIIRVRSRHRYKDGLRWTVQRYCEIWRTKSLARYILKNKPHTPEIIESLWGKPRGFVTEMTHGSSRKACYMSVKLKRRRKGLAWMHQIAVRDLPREPRPRDEIFTFTDIWNK